MCKLNRSQPQPGPLAFASGAGRLRERQALGIPDLQYPEQTAQTPPEKSSALGQVKWQVKRQNSDPRGPALLLRIQLLLGIYLPVFPRPCVDHSQEVVQRWGAGVSGAQSSPCPGANTVLISRSPEGAEPGGYSRAATQEVERD